MQVEHYELLYIFGGRVCYESWLETYWNGSWLETYRDIWLTHELCIGFGLRCFHYGLMGSFADYDFSSRWRLLIIR